MKSHELIGWKNRSYQFVTVVTDRRQSISSNPINVSNRITCAPHLLLAEDEITVSIAMLWSIYLISPSINVTQSIPSIDLIRPILPSDRCSILFPIFCPTNRFASLNLIRGCNGHNQFIQPTNASIQSMRPNDSIQNVLIDSIQQSHLTDSFYRSPLSGDFIR